MVVLFASFRRFDKTTTCSIVTNANPERYCSRDIIKKLDELSVEIIILPFDKRSRPNTRKFGNVLYLLDVIKEFSSRNLHDLYIFLDPDCIFLSDPSHIWQEIIKDDLLFYDVGTDKSGNIAGLSLAWLEAFASQNGWRLNSTSRHVGGEFLAVSRTELPRLSATIEQIRSADTRGVLTMEEHYLSLAVAKRGLGDHAFNEHIRRIWTGPVTKNARADDMALTIWHAPREKEFGFSDLYRDLTRTAGAQSWVDLSASQYPDYLSKRMGIPTWSSRKWAYELPKILSRKLARAANSNGRRVSAQRT